MDRAEDSKKLTNTTKIFLTIKGDILEQCLLFKIFKKISTHLLIMEVDFCPVLCILEVPVLQAFRGISHFVWYCKAVSDLS